MSGEQNRRAKHRRFSDRRVAVMLIIYEALFEEAPGSIRDARILKELSWDYETDSAAFLKTTGSGDQMEMVVTATSDPSNSTPEGKVFDGRGLRELLSVQQSVSGAITLSRFRRPSILDQETWDQLWENDLAGMDATGLLSVAIVPERAMPYYLWLVLSGSSREWTSHDRNLAEEVATLMGKAADRALDSA